MREKKEGKNSETMVERVEWRKKKKKGRNRLYRTYRKEWENRRDGGREREGERERENQGREASSLSSQYHTKRETITHLLSITLLVLVREFMSEKRREKKNDVLEAV